LGVSDGEADKLVMLSRITVLTRAKLAERGKASDVDVVIDNGVGLLDNDDIGVWAGEAPENHSRGPEGAAVIDLEREALVVASQVLKAVWKEVGSFPVAETHDIAHVPEVVRKAVKSQPEIAGEGAEPGGLESVGEGTGEFASHEHGRCTLSA
jgi:hypothetical protein